MCATVMGLMACSDNDGKQSHNPNQPIEVSGFSPESGYAATKVLIQGNNFGTDPSKIEVYFNEKKATVIGSSGDELYVITPKMPGNDCTVKVKIGESEATANKHFQYITAFSVGTLCGWKGDVNNFVEGTLAETQFNGSLCFLVFDKYDNLFGTQGGSRDGEHCMYMINEEANMSKTIFTTTNTYGTPQVPMVDPRTQIIYAPTGNYEQYFEIDPDTGWGSRIRTFSHPTQEQMDEGMKDYYIRWKHAFAYSDEDPGFMYTRSWHGDLIKFDLVTKVGQKVGDTMAESDAYLYFDPNDQTKLYITYTDRHCIYVYDIKTHTHELFAGARGIPDYIDGPKSDARFNMPRQILIDSDGAMFIADCNNHCIRKIDKNGIVSTVVGIGKTAGYVDGNPEEALLDSPWGLAIDSKGIIYIADRGNRCIRKLAVQ